MMVTPQLDALALAIVSIAAAVIAGAIVLVSQPTLPILAPTAATRAQPEMDAAASASRAMTFAQPKDNSK
jgi:hypothetical protein